MTRRFLNQLKNRPVMKDHTATIILVVAVILAFIAGRASVPARHYELHRFYGERPLLFDPATGRTWTKGPEGWTTHAEAP